MTSQAQAILPLPDVCGLVFLGFPLHPAGKPSVQRAAHLSAVTVPMLFLQGSRGALAQAELMGPVAEQSGGRATLVSVLIADHSFHVPVRSGRTDTAVLGEMLDAIAA